MQSYNNKFFLFNQKGRDNAFYCLSEHESRARSAPIASYSLPSFLKDGERISDTSQDDVKGRLSALTPSISDGPPDG